MEAQWVFNELGVTANRQQRQDLELSWWLWGLLVTGSHRTVGHREGYGGDGKLGTHPGDSAVLGMSQRTLLPWALESELKRKGTFDVGNESKRG